MSARVAVTQAAVVVATVAGVSGVVFSATHPLGWEYLPVAVIDLVFVSVALVGSALVRADGRNRAGWVFVVSGTAMPVSGLLSSMATAAFHHGFPLPGRSAYAMLALVATVLGIFLLGTFGILWFPDGGRRHPALTLLCAVELGLLVFWALFSTPLVADASIPNPFAPPRWLSTPAAVAGVAIVLFAPVAAVLVGALFRRARGTADVGTRSALRLAAWCAASVPVAFLVCVAVSFAGLDNDAVTLLENLSGLVIGVGAWVGIRRYGLLDLRAVVNRALLYTALTAVVTVAYLLVALALGGLVTGSGPRLVITVAVALLVLPLRDRVQQGVNRLLFGLRDQPGASLARLSARLEAAALPEDVLPAAARTVGQALRLSFVEIEADGEALASYGSPTGSPAQRLPLVFAGETVGELRVETGQGDDPLRVGPRSGWDGLTAQLAVVVRNLTLTRALAASRESLVSAHEEERLRMRRELHDGLGPALGAVLLQVESSQRALLGGRAEQAADQLTGVYDQVHEALTTVRRIAYGLRPPILDELGLGAALREHASRLGLSPPAVSELPELPAAVEVATYRIAVEAMSNSVRHAGPATVALTLTVNGQVELEVRDDGRGLPLGYRAGVGLTSMRERAAELGGTCTVETTSPHGTLVRAVLPLRAAAIA